MNRTTNPLPPSECAGCSASTCGGCPTAQSGGGTHLQFNRREVLRHAAVLTAAMATRPWDRLGAGVAYAADAPLGAAAPPMPKSAGPIVTTLEEFYKMGPGPSSSHTMGPMRIAYNFYQRVVKLPVDQLQRATALKVYLYGSLSQTGKGHGTDKAALAGLLGQSPASCKPEFLDSLAAHPTEVHKVKIGPKMLDVTMADIVFGETKGDFPHPNTMTCKLLAGDETVYELEYYSVGGGFIEWKGYVPPEKGAPKYPYNMARDFKRYILDDRIPLRKVLIENEMAISGRSEKQIREFLDQVIEVMIRGVDTGLKADGVLPGPIKLHSKAAELNRNLRKSNKGPAGKAITQVAAYAFAMAEENARGHIIVTAPTGGSAGILPAVLHSLQDLKVSREKQHDGLLAAAAIGYLCKHNATLAGAEGGCQAEVGVGSAMAAAMVAQATDAPPRVIGNAAESALEAHLGMTCDPVAGYVQIPCIERCAYGAVKAWTAYSITSEEVPDQRRVDLDTCIAAMALTAKDMNGKYKETSEGGLAVSLVLC